jgi:predicted ester cyclase
VIVMSDALLAQRTSTRDLPRAVHEFVAALNRGDLDGAVAQLAPDALHVGRVSNYRPEGVRLLFDLLLQVLPDLRLDIRAAKVEGNRVVSRVVATGTHTGSFLGKPATGNPMVWESLDVAEIETEADEELGYGRITKRVWDVWGDPELWRQIGFIPAAMC